MCSFRAALKGILFSRNMSTSIKTEYSRLTTIEFPSRRMGWWWSLPSFLCVFLMLHRLLKMSRKKICYLEQRCFSAWEYSCSSGNLACMHLCNANAHDVKRKFSHKPKQRFFQRITILSRLCAIDVLLFHSLPTKKNSMIQIYAVRYVRLSLYVERQYYYYFSFEFSLFFF